MTIGTKNTRLALGCGLALLTIAAAGCGPKEDPSALPPAPPGATAAGEQGVNPAGNAPAPAAAQEAQPKSAKGMAR